jgi:hypothetical protein
MECVDIDLHHQSSLQIFFPDFLWAAVAKYTVPE